MTSASESEEYVDRKDEEHGSKSDDDAQDETNVRRSRRHTTKRQERMRSNKRDVHVKEYTKIWSDYEKKILLNLLYEHGDENLEKLAAGLPNKHVSQVKTYIRTISRRAFVEEKNRVKKKELLELDKWIEYLKDRFNEQPIDDRIPFELFASSQEFCVPNKNFNAVIDFQKAYEYLFALTIGRKIDVDEKTYYFVHSYFDWFTKSFVKNVLPNELLLLKSSLKKLKASNMDMTFTPIEILHLIFHKVSSNEFFNCRHLLKTICKKVKHTNFNRGEEYDRKISLIRAEVDDEPAGQTYCYLDRSEVGPPFFNNVHFKNLTTFLWGALFNFDIEDMHFC